MKKKSSFLDTKNKTSTGSKYPIYPRLITEKNGEKAWKEEYKYLDSIDVYVMTYLSDGLNVRGMMVKPKKAGNYPCVICNRGGNRKFGSLVAAHGAMWLG
ncbi:MAG: hypothetical protein AB8F74_02985, partial [Saprospiraceae bacterium]